MEERVEEVSSRWRFVDCCVSIARNSLHIDRRAIVHPASFDSSLRACYTLGHSMSPSQTNLFPVLNQGLFSTNFLDTKFLDFSIWNDTPGLLERTSQARELILVAYNSAKRAGVFEARDEQKTEDKFIRPVLKALGWVYDPQPRHKRRKAKVRPDYALFASTEEYETAARSPDEPKTYYSRAQAIAEAKY